MKIKTTLWPRHEKHLRFAILPVMLDEGKKGEYAWLCFYWKYWYGPGYSWLSTWWVNTLTPPKGDGS